MPWVGGVYTRTNGVNTGATLWAADAAQGFNIITSHHDTNDQDMATGLNNCVTKDGLNRMAANFVPNVSGSYSLGTSTLKWTAGYFGTGIFIYDSTASINLIAATLTANRTVTAPDATGVLVLDTNTQTISGKTFGPVGASAGDGGRVLMAELAANGTNVVGLKAPDSISADIIWTMPGADGSANQVLLTDGSGTLSFGSASAAGALLIANNLSDVASVSTSRTNLGLGDVATQNIGGGLQNVSTTLQTALVKNNQAMPYTLQTSDRGKTIDCTTSGTLSITAAATLGDGWWCVVANSTTSSNVTIDPNGSEKINNATTLTLGGSHAVLITCDGAQFFAVGQPVTNVFTASFTSTEQTPPGLGAALTVAHGLSAAPFGVAVVARCKITELGYAVGDEIRVSSGLGTSQTTSTGVAISADGTNVYISTGSSGTTPYTAIPKAGGAAAFLTIANWKLVVMAWL